MRILFILLSPTFGMHQYTSDITNRLADFHDVTLITMDGYPADRYSPKVDVHTPVKIKNTGLSVEGLKLWRLVNIKSVIKNIQPEVVHLTGPHLWNIDIVRWLRKKAIPVIHTIHDIDPHSGTRLGRLLPLWNKSIIQVSDQVLLHGNRYRERLISSGVPANKITFLPVLHLFLSYTKAADIKVNMPPLSYEPLVLFFGRIEKYKGVDNLLKAFAQLNDENIKGDRKCPRLIIAGPGLENNHWFESLPPGVEVRNRLINDDEACDLFQRCGLLALPYLDATQSALIPAAYFFKKPVLATRAGVFDEYVGEGKTGLLIDPGNIDELCKAVSDVIFDTRYLGHMGEAGRKWYDDQRDIETEALFKMYDSAARMNRY